MSTLQIQKPNDTEQQPSFDDVSKLFSLPFSEAADILSVSTTTLKKICIDNGLERWPHRKYVAGKSIEDIKKEAAVRKKTQRNNSIITSKVREKTPPASGALNSSGVMITKQPPGIVNRGSLTWRVQDSVNITGFETSTLLDEFKYGFPSSGLSVTSNRWWGSGDGASGAGGKDSGSDGGDCYANTKDGRNTGASGAGGKDSGRDGGDCYANTKDERNTGACSTDTKDGSKNDQDVARASDGSTEKKDGGGNCSDDIKGRSETSDGSAEKDGIKTTDGLVSDSGDGVAVMKDASDGSAVMKDASETNDGSAVIMDASKTNDGSADMKDAFKTRDDGSADMKDAFKTRDDGSADMKDVPKSGDSSTEVKDVVAKTCDGSIEMKDVVAKMSDGSDEMKDVVAKMSDGSDEIKDDGSKTGDLSSDIKDGSKTIVPCDEVREACKPSDDVKSESDGAAGNGSGTNNVSSSKSSSNKGEAAASVSYSLSSIRKRALEEGREALKLGIWKELSREDKMRKKEEKVLISRVFNKSYVL